MFHVKVLFKVLANENSDEEIEEEVNDLIYSNKEDINPLYAKY